jgi:hypothetical protein
MVEAHGQGKLLTAWQPGSRARGRIENEIYPSKENHQ